MLQTLPVKEVFKQSTTLPDTPTTKANNDGLKGNSWLENFKISSNAKDDKRAGSLANDEGEEVFRRSNLAKNGALTRTTIGAKIVELKEFIKNKRW